MRISTVACAAGLAILSASHAASAATLIPVVAFPGSTATIAVGISGNNTITGSWTDAGGIAHGFFGTIAGSYTSFDYTGNTAMGTDPRGINNNNLIVGYGPTDGTGSYIFGPEFEYNATTATMTTITKAGTPLDGIVQEIDNNGKFVGDRWVQSGSVSRIGYTGKNSLWKQDLSVFGSNRVAARGINKSGTIVGFFLGSDGFTHGFIQQNGTTTQVDFPDATEQDTYLSGINDKGVISGSWDDNSGDFLFKSFSFNTNTNTFTSIAIPGSTYQQAFGINNGGLIPVTSDAGNFIYCPKKPAMCAGLNARAIPDGRSITVAGGGYLHYAGKRVLLPHASAVTKPRGEMQP